MQNLNRPNGSIAMCTLIASFLGIAGCQMAGPPKQALDARAISAVQAEIKRQIGIYARASHNAEATKQQPPEFACGNGNIDFDVSTVKAELTVSTERTKKAGLALGIPWNGVTVGPSGEMTKGTTNTQVLTYNLWLTEPNLKAFVALEKPAFDTADLNEAPIASALVSLRRALIDSAKGPKGSQPCFTNYNPEKPGADAGNSFKLGLTYVKGGKTGLEIKVGIVDLTSSKEWKSTTGNTLTVAFVQRGLEELQRARDKVDVECKYPKTPDDAKCKQALAEFNGLKEKAGGSLIPTS